MIRLAILIFIFLLLDLIDSFSKKVCSTADSPFSQSSLSANIMQLILYIPKHHKTDTIREHPPII